MGTYLELAAKPGCEDQINTAYAALTDDKTDWLVYTDEIIKTEIAYIHSPEGESQKHLRSKTRSLKHWKRWFPHKSDGRCQIKLTSIRDAEVEHITRIQRVITFVVEQRALSLQAEGLDDARDLGYEIRAVRKTRARMKPVADRKQK